MGELEAAAAVLGHRARAGVSLAPLTTYRVGGPAALLLEIRDSADLELACRAVAASGIDVLVVGRGSNLLVADAGFPGLAVVLGDAFAEVEVDNGARRGREVRAGGAASLPVLARRTAAAAGAGLEWAVGIPGSVGGAVRMNAGGHGSDVAGWLQWARVVDLGTGDERRVDPSGLALGYRRSNVTGREIVVEAAFRCEAGDRGAAEAQIDEIVRWRRENQPGGSNAGSVFTNPPGDSAGRLVDASGLKGFRVGSAHVSAKHANFFLADRGGSADDVLTLIREVQRRVLDATGVELEPEVRLIAFDPEDRDDETVL